jgi:FkbM family methyltransferase
MITYAQNFEDVLLARAFSAQVGGVYVDIGASHPEHLSVTKHFYDRGWRGANVEPILRNYELFLSARPGDLNLNVAVGLGSGPREFHECIEIDALSTFDPEQAAYLKAHGYSVRSYMVETVTASHVFERLRAEVVDFLKIDVEGLESEVIQSVDWDRFRPKVLVIEATAPARGLPGWGNFDSVAAWGRWEPEVLASGYDFVHFDGLSRFYVRQENRELAPAFRMPVGYFDDVHFPLEIQLRAQLDRQAATSAELGRQLAEAGVRQTETEHRWAEAEQRQAETEELRAEAEQRWAETEQRRTEAEQRLAGIAAEKEQLARQLREIDSRRVRDRARDLALYTAKRIKYYLRRSLRRAATGQTACLPKISLVTPVINAAPYISETLDSVLSQDYPNLEYVIVDGGSTDGTLDIIRRYMERKDLPQRIAALITEPDGGMYDALGKGFERVSGEVLGYLNADDLLEVGGLAAVGAYFGQRPNADVVFHEDAVLVDGWKYPNVRQPSRVSTRDLLGGHILFQDGVFFRRRLYHSVGGVRRDLKYAGDYDLWLRMSARARFVRRPGHVSCFRIRPGQLSGDMDRYRAEMERSRQDFLAGVGRVRRWWSEATGLWETLSSRWSWAPGQDRLFFPIDFGNMPPPAAIAPAWEPTGPRSPIDGRPTERLMFSAMDTRFGDRHLNHIHLDMRHEIAVVHPRLDPDALDELYRKHYSSPPTKIEHPAGTSPYRQFSRIPLWEKLLLRIPVEKLARLFPTAWADNTLAELTAVLRKAGFDVELPLRILDVGCFEGRLLDQIRSQKPWVADGLERNETAAGVAGGKGHTVWRGHVERVTEFIPQERQFDVIFMGQSIEHVDDPVLVLRLLRMLLAPGGAIVLSTPNLDSRQIDWFGPTWAHWHPPYHRYIFSRRGLIALARQSGLQARSLRTFSHPYWAAMSIAQNWVGLGGSVSHAVPFEGSAAVGGWRTDFWAKVLWNRLGKGDYSFLVMTDA